MRTPRIARPRPGLPSWLRLPRRTARLRLTLLYGSVFAVCGTAVLALTYLLDGHAPPVTPLRKQPTAYRPSGP